MGTTFMEKYVICIFYNPHKQEYCGPALTASSDFVVKTRSPIDANVLTDLSPDDEDEEN